MQYSGLSCCSVAGASLGACDNPTDCVGVDVDVDTAAADSPATSDPLPTFDTAPPAEQDGVVAIFLRQESSEASALAYPHDCSISAHLVAALSGGRKLLASQNGKASDFTTA